MAGGDDDDGGALDRREMSPLARRAAATRRRIEAARAAAAATQTAPRSPTHLSGTTTGTSRMFGAPSQRPPPPSPAAAREDRKAGSPYNVGRVASSSFGTNLATPSGIAARNRADARAHARKIRVCVPMTAEWFKCGEHLRALAEAAEREDRNPSVAGSNPPTATNPSLWDRDDSLFVARAIVEEGKLNALIRSLAAHRQMIRRVRSRGGSLAWQTHVAETCAAVGLTRRECAVLVRRWEADAGAVLSNALKSSVEAAQTADAAALLRHCAAVLTWQDAMWMADEEADEAGVGVGVGVVGRRGRVWSDAKAKTTTKTTGRMGPRRRNRTRARRTARARRPTSSTTSNDSSAPTSTPSTSRRWRTSPRGVVYFRRSSRFWTSEALRYVSTIAARGSTRCPVSSPANRSRRTGGSSLAARVTAVR